MLYISCFLLKVNDFVLIIPQLRFKDRGISHSIIRAQHRLLNVLSDDNFPVRGLGFRLHDYYRLLQTK